MCIACSLTQSFDPARHDGVTYAALSEGVDAVAGTGTLYSIGVGDTFDGSLGSGDSADWVAVTLEAGTTYQIDLNGAGSGVGTLNDPLVRLYDSTGTQIASDDDGGPALDSSLGFTAATTGTYYIAASSFGGTGSGTYRITLTEPTPLSDGTLDDMALYLTEGYWGSERSWNTSSSNVITVNISGLTAEGQQLALWAFEAWEAVADIDFQVTTGSANITFDDNDSGAYASSYVSGSTITSSTINVGADWLTAYGTTIDSYSFSTYVHEIGHALGLGHQGNYNGSGNFDTEAVFGNDSWQLSVMSYFNQVENPNSIASYAELVTPMMVDILAIQNLYGAPDAATSATAGATIWGNGSNLGTYLDLLAQGQNYGGAPVAMTIYDVGGIDTLNLTHHGTYGSRVDMNDETFSDVGGLIGNLGIARGTVIENLITGNGNDTVTGNAVANDINVGAGADSVHGGLGADTIEGGAGNDTLSGGDDADEVWGGLGADVLSGGAANDLLGGGSEADTLTGDGGADTLYGGSGADMMDGGIGDDVLGGGQGADTLYGRDGNDVLWAGTEDDLIYGAAGTDRMGGGEGADTLWGGTENDTLYGGELDDFLYGEEHNDILGSGSGHDSLDGGAGADNLWGAGGNDTLIGGDGVDTLGGGAGADLLDGGTGSDTLRGGAGNDTLYAGGANDVLFGEGDDDLLAGGSGVDWLDGGTGNDTLIGGADADRFVFRAGDGLDTVSDLLIGTDRLLLDDALWTGTLSATQVLSTYGADVGADFVLSFDGGEQIVFTGLAGSTTLDTAVDIF
ncbi:M10 family metallopeptidase C-terminal domain-containing protein [Citreimonas salinaria]|uniref:Serralysin n=1 Tax=Citreimonas salinaria TaxID=321339 RepID=A0A1H3N497_9RHOB|nr:M10 family metallopeptidase C-terminal domain-containing protein [Citreimonas salinaria]SDY83702.1 serralysin [Citreimonas salinaria]